MRMLELSQGPKGSSMFTMLPMLEAKEGRITMKKIATLLLAAGMIFGVVTNSNAIDFKLKGEWIMSFDYGKNGNFSGGNGQTGSGWGNGSDEFDAYQRLRFQMDAVASEALSGQFFIEVGNQDWGTGNQGGALGADGTNSIKVRRAFIDWIVPETDLKVRMGLQGLALPSFTTQSQVFNDDVAGINLSYQFNENVGLTAFWIRPYNDNYSGNGTRNAYQNYMDNIDMFALVLPLTFDGVKVTPWAMYGAIGPNAFRDDNDNYMNNFLGASRGQMRSGLMAVGGARHKDGTLDGKPLDEYGNAFWAGLTGEVTAFDPFRIAWDVNFGTVSYDDSRMNRTGWLASLLFEYKLDWAIPGIYGWYGSGDDDNPANGSERMPYVSVGNTNNGFSNLAFNGHPWTEQREGTLGRNMSGTWGVGARLKDMSFVENLKHTLYLNVIGGTNSTTMAKRYISPNGVRSFGGEFEGANSTGLGMDPLYMTTNDTAMEVGFTTNYKMYDNFDIYLDAAYIATWLDHSRSVWGNSVMNGRNDEVRDPWNVNLSFVYSF